MERQPYTCEDIRQLVKAGAQLVDVRNPDEYAMGALPGAVNLPLQSIRATAKALDRERPVLVYCHSGKRSEQARQHLSAMQFPSVWNIGGIEHYRHCHDGSYDETPTGL